MGRIQIPIQRVDTQIILTRGPEAERRDSKLSMHEKMEDKQREEAPDLDAQTGTWV